MRVVLIRHGKTTGNIERRYSGCRTDDPLAEEGIAALCRITVDENSLLFVSPMKRAKETAEILFPELEQRIEHDVREMDFGRFDGKTHAELDGDPDYQAWIDSGGTAQIPEGESMLSFRDRTMECFRRIIREATADGARPVVYIVAHGGTIMALMNSLTGIQYYSFLVDNGTGFDLDLEVDDAGNIVAVRSYGSFYSGIRS